MLPIRKILGSTDFSIAGYPAVKTAGELASQFGAELVLIHVVLPAPPPPPLPPGQVGMLPSTVDIERYERDEKTARRQELERLVTPLLPKELSYRAIVTVGSAAEEIVRVAQAEGVDLLVISTHGRTGWRHFAFGSVAEKVVRTATCPVLVVQSSRQAPEDPKH